VNRRRCGEKRQQRHEANDEAKRYSTGFIST
jgi:hypothetical protein